MDYNISRFSLSETCSKKIFSGKYYNILFILSGYATFTWEGGNIACGSEELLLLKPGKMMTILFRGGKTLLDAIWLQVAPEAMGQMTDERTNLSRAVNVYDYNVAAMRIDNETLMLCKNLAQQMTFMARERDEFAHTLYEESMLTILMVLVLRGCMRAEFRQREKTRRHLYIDDVFAYISAHIADDLTLEKLEKTFFVDKSHLSREFKQKTGITLHRYIVKTKLDYCLPYIEAGQPITEVYKRAGFAGYNHFFRAFKKQYGMTPKEYYRNTTVP